MDDVNEFLQMFTFEELQPILLQPTPPPTPDEETFSSCSEMVKHMKEARLTGDSNP